MGGGKTNKEAVVIHRVMERYRNFKRLHDQLHAVNKELLSNNNKAKEKATNNNNAMNHNNPSLTTASVSSSPSLTSSYCNFMDLIKAPFPATSINSYVGLSLSARALTERCDTIINTVNYLVPLPLHCLDACHHAI